jgi:Putative protein-S-isoprenylcysteine methyltransferase
MEQALRFRFLKAVVAFLVLPGVIAFGVPLFLRPAVPEGGTIHWTGLGAVAIGSILLLWCVRDFYVAGKGTLAPWSPPRKLVTTGLYRRSRNPMYLAVAAILIGWSMWFMSWTLLWYAVLVILAFHFRVVRGEEPWLAETHGDEWRRYAESVPRWFSLRRRVLIFH